MTNPSVYLETSFISYLTARSSRDLIVAGHQVITAEWWENRRHEFELFVSRMVIDEVRRGDPQAVARRMSLVQGIVSLDISKEVYRLTDILIDTMAIPREALPDALHVAVACVNGINYLLTWNCKKHYATLEQASQLAQTNPLEFQQLTAHHPHQNDTSLPVNVNLGKLANLKPRNYIIGDPEDWVHIDWSREWKEWPE